MASVSDSIFDTPAYSCRQAAHYLGLSYPTLLRWTNEAGLIITPEAGGLSFNNLAEAHVLSAMRRVHGIPLQRIRKSLEQLAIMRESAHPLLDETFETDGVNLCIREAGDVINLSQKGQKEFRELVSLYLRRIERSSDGKIARLYPFIVDASLDEPRNIVISPVVSFGKPVLAGTGISTSVIVGRFNARDSIQDLAKEYSVSPAMLEDAIRWEMNQGKAA